jgi:hypothetical protein
MAACRLGVAGWGGDADGAFDVLDRDLLAGDIDHRLL